MRQSVLLLVAIFAVLPALGCGTLVNQSPPGSYFNHCGQVRANRIYGGVRINCEHVAEIVTNLAHGDTSNFTSTTTTSTDPETGKQVTRDTTSRSEKVANAVMVAIATPIDFTLSFVADTIYLPHDIAVQWRQRTGREPMPKIPESCLPCKEENEEQAGPPDLKGKNPPTPAPDGVPVEMPRKSDQ